MYSKLKAQAKEGKVLEETQVVEWFVQIAMALQVCCNSYTMKAHRLNHQGPHLNSISGN